MYSPARRLPPHLAAGLFGLLAGAAPSAAQDVIHAFSGQSGDDFGLAVSDAGDVNLDGYADVVVGAIQDGVPSAGAGYARVFSGVDGTSLHTFHGDDPGDTFGNSVGSAGDVNMDGVPDVVVGAVWDDAQGAFAGSVRVFSGADGAVLLNLLADSPGDFFGLRVSSAGDVDGDGRVDILVGAVQWMFNDKGYARVYSGADGSILHHWNGAHNGSQFGYSVSDLGDVDIDGSPDVVVGAWFENLGASGTGSARVFSGASGAVLYTFAGKPGAHMGSSVATAGHVDTDGVPDIILGASGDATAGSYAGGAYVYSGASGALLHAFHGFSPGDQLGNAVHGAGDVDGDGRGDLVVGAIHAEPAGQYSGSAYVFSGADGALLNQLDGTQPSEFLGGGVSGAGDVNGDGAADVIVGAKLSDLGQVDGGAAWVLSGRAFVEAFGQGCAGLSATSSGTPSLGDTLVLKLAGALPGAPAWPFLGVSESAWQGLPLPLDLGLFGAPGCLLLASPDIVLPSQIAGATGQASFSLGLPLTSTLVGKRVFAQWLALDLAAVPIAIASTNGLGVTVQP